jgi:DNA-binding MarR family transcriptional regulator
MAQERLLAYISEHPDTLPMDAARATGVSPATAGSLTRRLVDDGVLVEAKSGARSRGVSLVGNTRRILR